MNPIAFMFMIIAAALITPFMFTAIASQGQQERATVAAMQMARIDKAAQGYITANAAAIEGSSTATKPAIITVPMLVNTGYLPNGFNAGNPYGQTWQVQVLQPATKQLQALVVSTGGQNVDAKQAGMVSQAAGSAGGVIGGGTGKLAIPHCGAGEACGVYQGWDVSTNGYQNVSPGHLAALIEYSNGQLQSDYMYRTAVPGQPQLNTMETNLNMGANNINNAQNVNVNQDVDVGNTIHFTHVHQPDVQPGSPCHGAGTLIGSSYDGGTLLVCQNGQWSINGSPSIVYQGWTGKCSIVYDGTYSYCSNVHNNNEYITTAAYCTMNGRSSLDGILSERSGSPGAYKWYFSAPPGYWHDQRRWYQDVNTMYVTCYN